MKNLTMLRNVSFAALVLVLFSCTTDSEDETNELLNAPTAAELLLAAQVDNTEGQSFGIIENAYVEGVEDTRSMTNSFFPDCSIITISPNGDGSGSIVVDFGDSCALNNGAMVSGQVSLTYSIILNESRTITYIYENFTYNGNSVTGGGTVLRQLDNGNGNPQSTVTSSIEVYFPLQDITATRTVNSTREWIEGVGSGTWTDNVVLVTGNWSTNFSSGLARSGEVTEALRREAICPHFVSGVLAITQNNFNGTLDFGDGTCDNIAVITINGQEFTIEL